MFNFTQSFPLSLSSHFPLVLHHAALSGSVGPELDISRPPQRPSRRRPLTLLTLPERAAAMPGSEQKDVSADLWYKTNLDEPRTMARKRISLIPTWLTKAERRICTHTSFGVVKPRQNGAHLPQMNVTAADTLFCHSTGGVFLWNDTSMSRYVFLPKLYVEYLLN